MLCAYLDETGHSMDQKQRFNGMAGLMAPAKRLARMERKWKKTLDRFRLPYFHMKDFASFRGEFSGWGESKRKDLYSRLLRHIEGANPFFVGSILAMEDYRSLSPQQQSEFGDPYYVGFMSVTVYLSWAAENLLPPGGKVDLVFSDQVEFRHNALRLYEHIVSEIDLIRQRTDAPTFHDMRTNAPLQAADLIAYELYKEFERQLDRPNAEPRHGYKEICAVSRRLGLDQPMFAFQTKSSLNIGGLITQPRWAGMEVGRVA